MAGATKNSTPDYIGANLRGAIAYSNDYAGGGLITVALVNVGSSDCYLSGYPVILGIRDGHAFPLSHVRHGTQGPNFRPATLRARMSGALILDTVLSCHANVVPLPPSDRYTGVIIVLPRDDGRVRIGDMPLNVPCGLA